MGVVWVLWVGHNDLGSQVSLGTLKQHLDQRNSVDPTLSVFELTLWGTAERAEQDPTGSQATKFPILYHLVV